MTLAAAADDARLSNLGAVRDIKLTASQTITLGEAHAGRDLIVHSPSLLANALSAGHTCTVGAMQCSAGTSVASNLLQNSPVLAGGPAVGSDLGADGAKGDGDKAGDGAKAAARASDRNSQPPLLTPAPVEAEVALTEPVVTGAGSEEIWRKHQRQPATPQPTGAKP